MDKEDWPDDVREYLPKKAAREAMHHYRIQVKYKGKWLNMCRADECDEVRTSYEGEPMSSYKPHYGAWITKTDFIAIDSFSDG